jgi:hypothetical protein
MSEPNNHDDYCDCSDNDLRGVCLGLPTHLRELANLEHEGCELEVTLRCAADEIERLQTERDAMRAAIDEHAKRMGAILTMPQGPKSAEEGLRFLAVWFDAMYPNDPDTQVQDDLRKWSTELGMLRKELDETKREIERLRAALITIRGLCESMPFGYDVSADVNDRSPEDASAHTTGLIVQACEEALKCDGSS